MRDRGRGARVGVALAFALAALASARVARANDNTAFDAAQSAFDAGQYAQSEKAFGRLLDPTNPPCSTTDPGQPCHLEAAEFIRLARAGRGAALVVIGRAAEADPLFEALLLDDPTWQPNEALFPEPALREFRVVKRRLQPTLDKLIQSRVTEGSKHQIDVQRAKDDYGRWIANLEQQASQEHLFQKNSRLIALLPFGVGQFQNGDRNLGFVVLGAEAALGGGSIVAA
ncbi:MAG TPA: hypothetical protein VGM56_29540, partial [Byssovorax sp.]